MHIHYHLVTRAVLTLIQTLNPVLFFSTGYTSGPHTNHIYTASCLHISVINAHFFDDEMQDKSIKSF